MPVSSLVRKQAAALVPGDVLVGGAEVLDVNLSPWGRPLVWITALADGAPLPLRLPTSQMVEVLA